MAMCINCGAIINKEDAMKHICNELNIPIKGKEKQPTTTEKVVQ